MKRYLTQENAAQYVGKYLECYPGRFHYYPLKVCEHNGKFYVIDRNGVAYLVPFKGEKGDMPIPFTRVMIPSTSIVPDDLPDQKKKGRLHMKKVPKYTYGLPDEEATIVQQITEAAVNMNSDERAQLLSACKSILLVKSLREDADETA